MSREVSFETRLQRDPTAGSRIEQIEAKVVVLGSQGQSAEIAPRPMLAMRAGLSLGDAS